MTTLRLPILKVIKYIVEKTSAVTWHRDLPLRGPLSDSVVRRGYRQGCGQDRGNLYKNIINSFAITVLFKAKLTLVKYNSNWFNECHLIIYLLCLSFKVWDTPVVGFFLFYQSVSPFFLPQASGRSFLTAVVLISLKNDPLCTQRKCEMYRKKFSLSATTVNPVT